MINKLERFKKLFSVSLPNKKETYEKFIGSTVDIDESLYGIIDSLLKRSDNGQISGAMLKIFYKEDNNFRGFLAIGLSQLESIH